MKHLKLFYDDDGFTYRWKAEHDSRNGGWIVTDHQGDKKFFPGCWDTVLDYMQRITLPNWGMRLLSVDRPPPQPTW